MAYTLNAVGTRTGRHDAAFAPKTFVHDAIDQLTGADYGGGRAQGFACDAMGNRTLATDTATGSPTAYTARPDNAYAGVGGVPATHDANGNMTDTTTGTTLEYDAMNRLTRATRATRAGTVVEFAHDGLNCCVTRTISRPVGTTETTRLVHSDWNLVEERDAHGTLTARYTHGATIDDILTRTDASGALHYHREGLMSTIALSDANGDIIERVRYDAFGLPEFTDAEGLPLAESSTGNRFLFTGRDWLEDVQIYDYRHRAYSPALGRFLQTDSIRFAAGDFNIYRYVGNNPANWVDPWGLQGSRSCWDKPNTPPFDDGYLWDQIDDGIGWGALGGAAWGLPAGGKGIFLGALAGGATGAIGGAVKGVTQNPSYGGSSRHGKPRN